MQCPGCGHYLESHTVEGQIVERCGACGGEYFTHQALSRLLSAHAASPGAKGEGYTRPSPLSDPVRYRACPECGEMMLRKNFHETSGIVVDACAAHGIWFDRGELAMALRFAATGAMAEADRHMVERAAARKRLDAFARDLRAVGPRHYIGGIGDVMVGPIDDLADISRVIPGIDPEDD